jgi:hypothetical protein
VHRVCLLSQLYYTCEPPRFDYNIILLHSFAAGEGEIPWCFSQVKGTIEDEVADGKDTEIVSAGGVSPSPPPPHTHTQGGVGGGRIGL